MPSTMLPQAPGPVFICYAKEDIAAAANIFRGLKAAGIDVWMDEERGLRGGDVWKQRIREMIWRCSLFVPIISANTESRHEGYFRVEWKLALERRMGLADDIGFLYPVSIDDSWANKSARVPKPFLDVQWTRLRCGATDTGFTDDVKRLVASWTPTQNADAKTQPSDAGIAALSTRLRLSSGSNFVVCGFVLSGTRRQTILVRAVGPGLARFSVPGCLQDPVLELFDSRGRSLAPATMGWMAQGDSNASSIKRATDRVGAFELAIGSEDSALLLGLSPGLYTANISSASKSGGEILVEIYCVRE